MSKFKNNIKLMLIGNKFDSGADSDEYRLMTQVAEENDAEFISASAKNNQSIEKITNKLAFYALEHNKRQQSKATVTPVSVPRPITSYEANKSFESEPRRSLYKSKVEESKYENYEGGEKEEDISEDEFEPEDLFRTRSLLKDSITIKNLLTKSRIEEIYSTQEFIKDLIEVLDNEEFPNNLDEADIPKIFSWNRFDFKLHRNLHLYEMMFLLAQGIWPQSLLQLLYWENNSIEILEGFETSKNRLYNMIWSIISIVSGDVMEFSTTWQDLVEKLELKSEDDISAEDKALRWMMIAKGSLFLGKYEITTHIQEQYEAIFEALFGHQKEKAMAFHRLVSLDESRLVELIWSFSEPLAADKKLNAKKKMRENVFDIVMMTHLNLDAESFKCWKSLILASLGETSDLQYVLKQLKLPKLHFPIYKGLVSTWFYSMRSLLSRFSPSISLSLSSCLYHILDGDISSILSFLPKSEYNQEEIKKKQEEYLFWLFQLLQRNSFDSFDQLNAFLNKISWDKLYAKAIYGFNALLNWQVDDIPEMFKLFDNKIDTFTMDSIKKNNKNRLKNLIISIAQQLASVDIGQISDDIKNSKSRPQYKFIKNMIKAMNGNIYSFGEFWDMIFYDNQLWFCSLFTSIAQKQNVFGFKDRFFTAGDELIKRELFERHTKKLFEKIYSLTENKNGIKKLFNKHGMESLLMQLIWRDNRNIHCEKIITNLFSLSHNEMKDTLKEMLISKDHIDKLDFVFIDSNFKKLKIAANIPEFEANENILSKELVSFLEIIMNFYLQLNSKISELQNLKSLESSYSYSLDSNKASINVSKLFQLLLKVRQRNEKEVDDLIRICYRVFRYIPWAIEILLVAKLCYKQKKWLTVDEISMIVRLLMVSTIDFSNLRAAEKMFIYSIDAFKIQDVSKLLRLVMLMISKNISCKNNDHIRDTIREAFDQEENSEMVQDFFLYIIGLANGNFEQMAPFAKRVGFFSRSKVRQLYTIFEKYQSSILEKDIYGLPEINIYQRTSYFSSNNNMNDKNFMFKKSISELSRQTSKLTKIGDKRGFLTQEDGSQREISSTTDIVMHLAGDKIQSFFHKNLFELFDKDGSGYLSYSEFCDLCKYMGLSLNQEESLRLFAIADENQNNYIDVDEFEKAMKHVKITIALNILQELGVTPAALVWTGVATILTLFILLLFVFMGIFAFSKAESFSAVINSFLPLFAGIVALARGINVEQKVKEAKTMIMKTFDKFKRSIE